MDSKTVVRYTLEAIESVKSRVRRAEKEGDMIEVAKLMGDLYGLECVLVHETTRLMEEMGDDDAA